MRRVINYGIAGSANSSRSSRRTRTPSSSSTTRSLGTNNFHISERISAALKKSCPSVSPSSLLTTKPSTRFDMAIMMTPSGAPSSTRTATTTTKTSGSASMSTTLFNTQAYLKPSNTTNSATTPPTLPSCTPKMVALTVKDVASRSRAPRCLLGRSP